MRFRRAGVQVYLLTTSLVFVRKYMPGHLEPLYLRAYLQYWKYNWKYSHSLTAQIRNSRSISETELQVEIRPPVLHGGA